MGLGTRRIAQRGLSRQTEGQAFYSPTTSSYKTGLLPHTIQEEFNRNIESLAKRIKDPIQRFRSGVKKLASHRVA